MACSDLGLGTFLLRKKSGDVVVLSVLATEKMVCHYRVGLSEGQWMILDIPSVTRRFETLAELLRYYSAHDFGNRHVVLKTPLERA